MYFINAISYPSDGINVIPCQLFPKILNVRIHNPIFSEIISTPHSIQKLISGEHTSLIQKELPQKLKLFLGKLHFSLFLPHLVTGRIQL